MAPAEYDRLSSLDNSFLLMEDPNAYMHMASVAIFEAAPLRTANGGIDFEAIRNAMGACLHLIPRYRQKLKQIPLVGLPVWVDDRGFNLHYHVRHTSLPHPGTERQLKRLSARIMSQHLDRTKPLWEMWVVEGLEGDRLAVINKVHHCMVDGVAGVDIMTLVLRTSPEHEIPDPAPFLPRPTPSGLELLRDEVVRRATLPLQALRDVQSFAGKVDDLRHELLVRGRAAAKTLGWLRPHSETPINQPLGSHRRFDWAGTEIADIRTIRKALGGSLNDVVLATVAGGVRSYLKRRYLNPRETPFRVLAPVSVRTQTGHGVTGNRVSAWMIDLPIGESDPRERLRLISQQTAELKESQQAIAADILTRVADFTPTGLFAMATRSVVRMIPFNMVVTNVPGPQIPLYLLGAKMLEWQPCVPLAGDLGLGIALLSYNGRIFWGFNADWEAIPDLHDFVNAIEESFEELREAAHAA
jgi:WS/DGAT/MGAT family acyltransferase